MPPADTPAASLPKNASEARPRQSLTNVFFGVGLAFMIGILLWLAKPILVPLVTATLLSFLIVSLKKALSRLPGIGRFLGGAVGFVLSFAIMAMMVLTLALIVRNNAEAVLEKAPDYQERLQELAQNFAEWADAQPMFPTELVDVAMDVADGIGRGIVPENLTGPTEPGSARDNIRRQLIGAIRGAISSLTAAAGSLLGGVVTIFLYTAFILIERGRFGAKLAGIAGSQSGRLVLEGLLDDIGELVRRYLSMKTLINLSVASISFCLMLVLGTDFAGFWALLIFLFGYVPIIGAVIAISLPTLLTLLQPGAGPAQALLTLVVLTGAEQTISSFVEPRVMGRTLNLSPLVILLSLSVWGALWGFAGMLLAVPMTVVLLIVLSQFDITRPVAVLLSDNGQIAPIRRAELGGVMPPHRTEATLS